MGKVLASSRLKHRRETSLSTQSRAAKGASGKTRRQRSCLRRLLSPYRLNLSCRQQCWARRFTLTIAPGRTATNACSSPSRQQRSGPSSTRRKFSPPLAYRDSSSSRLTVASSQPSSPSLPQVSGATRASAKASSACLKRVCNVPL